MNRAAAALEPLVALSDDQRGDEPATLDALRSTVAQLAAALEVAACALVVCDRSDPGRVRVVAARTGADAAPAPPDSTSSPRRLEGELLPDAAAAIAAITEAAGEDPSAPCWHGILLDPMRGRPALTPTNGTPLLVVVGRAGRPHPAMLSDELERVAVTLCLELDRLRVPWLVAFGPDRETVSRLADDNVQFTVYRPRALPAATRTTVLVFAHLADAVDPGGRDPLAAVADQARRMLDNPAGYRNTTSDATRSVPRGGALSFQLTLEGCLVDPPEQTFRWLTDVHRCEFAVYAPPTLVGTTVRGELAVYLGVLWIGSVMLQLPVVGPDAAPAVAETETDPASTSMDKYVFPSYARRDQAIVEETMAWVEPLGLEYWQDLRMLRSGDVWSERLRELIANAGRFQLFWSDAAQRSGEVANEYRYALELRKPIRGSYWQAPPPPFPDELAKYHFARLPDSAMEIAHRLDSPRPGTDDAVGAIDLIPVAAELPSAAAAPPAPAAAARSGPPRPRRKRPRAPLALGAGVTAVLAVVVLGVGALAIGGSERGDNATAIPTGTGSNLVPTPPSGNPASGPMLSGAVLDSIVGVPATGDDIGDVLPGIGATCLPAGDVTVVSGSFLCGGGITVTLARFAEASTATAVFTRGTTGIGEHDVWAGDGAAGDVVSYQLPPGKVGLSWTYRSPAGARTIVGDAIADEGTDLEAWWKTVRTPVVLDGV